jgi:hypothetical protein
MEPPLPIGGENVSRTVVGSKVHPTTREWLPDDPLDLHACQVPGDPLLMLRLLVEEYARMGWTKDDILQLARDPNYRGFHGLLQLYGEVELRRRVTEVISRCGVIRVRTVEAPAESTLVQITIT